MKKQKENSHEGITWSEMGKQNVQAEKVYSQTQTTLQREESNDTFTLNCFYGSKVQAQPGGGVGYKVYPIFFPIRYQSTSKL